MSFQSRDRLTIEPDLFVTPATAANVARPSFRRRLAVVVEVWRERTVARRCLAQMDARSLRIGSAILAEAGRAALAGWILYHMVLAARPDHSRS